MSHPICRRRLLQPATSIRHHTLLLPSYLPFQHRTLSLRSLLKPKTLRRLNPFKSKSTRRLDPTIFRQQKDQESKKLPSTPKRAPRQQGDLAPTSIFSDPSEPPNSSTTTKPRDPLALSASLDPTPPARKRYQRKLLIRSIRHRHRLTPTMKIARTERQHTVKSPLIKTSVKKLYPLARQITGKPLGEAMVQMRFSKKKAAQDVLRHLEFARDQAVVVRGMGLGGVEGSGVGNGDGEGGGDGSGGNGLVVEDKKGKKRVVGDKSAMYVDEAWVGRGPYEFGSLHRARGRIDRLRLPYTSISVVLKEEATRIRQAEEREAKRLRKKVWVPLPDRPIMAQRQYPLW